MCESLKCVDFCSLGFLFVSLVCVCMCVFISLFLLDGLCVRVCVSLHERISMFLSGYIWIYFSISLFITGSQIRFSVFILQHASRLLSYFSLPLSSSISLSPNQAYYKDSCNSISLLNSKNYNFQRRWKDLFLSFAVPHVLLIIPLSLGNQWLWFGGFVFVLWLIYF